MHFSKANPPKPIDAATYLGGRVHSTSGSIQFTTPPPSRANFGLLSQRRTGGSPRPGNLIINIPAEAASGTLAHSAVQALASGCFSGLDEKEITLGNSVHRMTDGGHIHYHLMNTAARSADTGSGNHPTNNKRDQEKSHDTDQT